MPTRETALVIRIFLEADPLLQPLAEAKSWHSHLTNRTWDRWLYVAFMAYSLSGTLRGHLRKLAG